MNRLFCFLFLFLLFSGTSCLNRQLDEEGVNPDTIYFDYKITANESDDNLTVMLQYRDGEDGDAIAIKEPGAVLLDGEPMSATNTKMSGTFYEVHKPIAAFAGKHNIVFRTIDKKEYKEEFNFRPVSLSTAFADTFRRNDLALELDGLDTADFIRVLMTDTSFKNEGINRVDKVLNGRLVITKADLENLANGPIQLEFIREYERSVKNGTEEGGRLQITYSIKREFFLKD